jgi:hypothetical protein
VEPASRAPGDAPAGDPPAQEAPEKPAEPVEDLGEIENGAMRGQSVWKQEAEDGADLILDDGYARLGGYNRGRDNLHQKIRVAKDSELLAYDIKIDADARNDPSDRLVVRFTDEEGKPVANLKRYTAEDAGKWKRERLDVSRFAGRTVYLSFYVKTNPTRLTTFYLDNLVLRERAEAPTSE